MFIIEILKFFCKCLLTSINFAEMIEKNGIFRKFVQYFVYLSKIFQKFKIKALTMGKALDSIEYHKSETTKAILLTMKQISLKDLVSTELAYSYISCEELSQTLMDFFTLMLRANPNPKFKFDDKFFETCKLLMRVFKKSKKIHENVFRVLNKIDYTKEQAQCLTRLNYPKDLCDLIWRNTGWRHFALYILRFMEKLVANPDILSLLRRTVAAIKLVASIKNFINEEDYKIFEDSPEEGEQSETLTFSEEREIHKKSQEVMEKLMDATILDNIKSNINKTLKFFKPLPETIMILRAEYAVISCANGINHYGSEGLRSKM